MITKLKIKDKLKERLNRNPSKNEVINAEKDINILMELVLDELTGFENRLKILEDK